MPGKDHGWMLSFFSRDVLTPYRASPHLYELEEDDMGGELEPIVAGGDDDAPWFRIRFGFRRLAGGIVCVGAFTPDLKQLPKKDRLIWLGHALEHPQFVENDPGFERWVNRNLEGSWEVEDGPKQLIQRELDLLCALTTRFLGSPLWKYQANRLINYPISENTDAYYKAHLELYRLVIDGLDAKTIAALAAKLGVQVTDHTRTLGSLREVLPTSIAKAVYDPLAHCRDQRNRNHGGLGEPVKSFQAFDAFHRDVEQLAAGLKLLKEWLESEFGGDAEACLSRQNAFKGLFPRLMGPARPEFKAGELEKSVGKTICKVELGEEEGSEDVHQAEAIVLHFTDGSAMAIRVGSNAYNISRDIPKIKPHHFSTDLMVFWAPSGMKIIT